MKCAVKLPPIELPKFSGGTIQWLEFFSLFDSIIHQNAELSDIVKFVYLLAQLNGEAKDLLKGLPVISVNYSVALDILKEEYEDLQAAIDILYLKLMEIPPAKNVMELKKVYNQTEGHFRSLEALEQDVNHSIFVTILKSKIPRDILATLNFQHENLPWTVNSLRNAIKRYTKAYREVIEQLSSQVAGTDEQKPPVIEGLGVPEGLLVNSEKLANDQKSKMCAYCKNEHFSDQCAKFATLEERKNLIKGKFCEICFGMNHDSQSCHSRRSCYHCKLVGKHHRSLCPTKFGTTERNPQSQGLDQSKHQTEPLVPEVPEEQSKTDQLQPAHVRKIINKSLVTDTESVDSKTQADISLKSECKDGDLVCEHSHSKVMHLNDPTPDICDFEHSDDGITLKSKSFTIQKLLLVLGLMISIPLTQLMSHMYDGVT